MKEEADFIELRPHNLLCLINYIGIDYSEFFGKTIRDVYSKYTSGHAYVKIVESFDRLCNSCPNKRNLKCTISVEGQIIDNDPKIKDLDQSFLNLLGLEYGKLYRSDQLISLIQKKISAEQRSDTCNKCGFNELCKDKYSKFLKTGVPVLLHEQMTIAFDKYKK